MIPAMYEEGGILSSESNIQSQVIKDQNIGDDLNKEEDVNIGKESKKEHQFTLEGYPFSSFDYESMDGGEPGSSCEYESMGEEVFPSAIHDESTVSSNVNTGFEINEPLSTKQESKEEHNISSSGSTDNTGLELDEPLSNDQELKEGISPLQKEEDIVLPLTSNINPNREIHVGEQLNKDQLLKKEECILPSPHDGDIISPLGWNINTGLTVDESLNTDNVEGAFTSPSIKEEVAVSTLASNINTDIDIDEALKKTGSCGRFQYVTQIIITYLVIAFGYQAVLSYFIANDPPWKCIRNDTSTFCEQNFGLNFGIDSKQFTRRCKLNRTEWTYTTNKKYSIVTEFDLVCGKTSIAAFASSIYHIGGGIGIFISGIAADYFGRKYVLIVVLSILTAVSITGTFVFNSLQIIILRAFAGASTVSCYNLSYNYLTEFVPPNRRSLAAIIYGMGFAVSQILLDAAAYHCRYWRRLQLYASFPCILGIILLFFLPESPRWQLVNRKHLQAENTLKKIGKFNGYYVPSLTLKSPIVSKQRKYTYCDLIRNKRVAFVTMLQAFIWLTVEMCYYTIAFESSNLGGSMYQAFGLSALAEIPSKFMALYTCTRFGRKKSTLLSLVIAGTFLASTILVPHTLSYRYLLNIIMMMFAKFFIDVAEQSVYMWTFELFPTVLRLQGTGVCVVCARIGSFAAPFLTTVLQQVNAILPYIILTVFALSAAVAGLFLPETNKQPTRERYEDFFKTPIRSNTVQTNNDENTSSDIQMDEALEEM